MIRSAFLLLILILACAVIFLVATVPGMPDQVASHFDAGGVAHQRISRDGYLWSMLSFTVGLPLLLVFFMGVLPRAFPRMTNLPNREYWLSPAQINKTMDFLMVAACAIGALIALFVSGIHQCILIAHQQSPPRLPEGLFLGLMGAFLIGLTGLMILMYTHFGRAKSE